MTSINALRLDYHSGLLVCDEARYWNEEWMIFYTPEKIRSIIKDNITRNHNIVMFMGQTGTSSIGDEWINEVTHEITNKYEEIVKQCISVPESFMTLQELAQYVFSIITDIKTVHLNDFLKGKYGFTVQELIKGSYTSDKVKTKITDKECIEKAMKYITFEDRPDEVKGIFGNSQVLAGYSPEDGFKIFYMTERWPVCEEVREIFIAQGSGRDTCDLVFSRFADTKELVQRKGQSSIPRQEGLYAMLKGLNIAMNQTAGIGGYPKIIYVNGKAETKDKWVTEISDMRSKLALEIVMASEEELISQIEAESMLEDLIFEGKSFYKVNEILFESAVDSDVLRYRLRKYTK